ncbi:response regulator [Candidatus Omnitrophota bacterium]
MRKKKIRILVVDDDEDTLVVYDKTLSDAGYEVLMARNGKESVAVAKKEKPDVIIMDIMMPEADGIGSILKLKGDDSTRNIPIIVATSVEETDDRILAENLGVDGYIVKRVNMDTLTDKIEKVLKK